MNIAQPTPQQVNPDSSAGRRSRLWPGGKSHTQEVICGYPAEDEKRMRTAQRLRARFLEKGANPRPKISTSTYEARVMHWIDRVKTDSPFQQECEEKYEKPLAHCPKS